jgi:hypothetical protein
MKEKKCIFIIFNGKIYDFNFFFLIFISLDGVNISNYKLIP